jgi:hypothetical protein
MRILKLCCLLVVTGVLLSACKQVTQSLHDTFEGKPQKSKLEAYLSTDDEHSGSSFLTDAQRLAKAERALRDLPEFKGKPIWLSGDMHMYDNGRIMLSVQDPDTLGNVNAYEYSRDGEWGPGQPVKMTGNITPEMISSSAIPLNKLHFVTVAKMANVYADSARHVGSKTIINHIYYEPDVQEWYCNDIEAPRANYQMYFNPDGSVKEFRKE